MMAHVTELLHLVIRWVHLIAGIMWIGNSMLFNWLDRNLEMPDNAKKGLVGEIWMVHSGGFYQVEKKFLEPSQMPRTLHWFKWQNGITWMSGILLLVLVYYMGGAALTIDPAVSQMAASKIIGLGVGSLIAAFVLYDLLWRSPIGKSPVIAFVLSVAIVIGFSAVFFKIMSGRAAYIHVGVMLGTLMTGNVWFVILPSQRELVRSTIEGREQNPAIGYQAKQRSVHNNYMTFPLLFIMLSNHFPTTFGHKWNWIVLVVLSLGSAAIRHFMNIRFTFRAWLAPTMTVFLVSMFAMYFFFAHPMGFSSAPTGPVVTPITRKVDYAEIHPLMERRCTPCHSAHPTHPNFPAPPLGLMLDTPEQIIRNVEKIRLRAVSLQNMPLANLTNMTPDERELLRAWIDQGAHGP